MENLIKSCIGISSQPCEFLDFGDLIIFSISLLMFDQFSYQEKGFYKFEINSQLDWYCQHPSYYYH
jgi:hypothetical protein